MQIVALTLRQFYNTLPFRYFLAVSFKIGGRLCSSKGKTPKGDPFKAKGFGYILESILSNGMDH